MENKLLAGVYVHLPFCSVHCTYCDFSITTRVSLSDRYYSALLNEVDRNLPHEKIDTIYFGGGTPSLAPVEVLRQLIAKLRYEPNAEINLEANPDHVNKQKLTEWAAAGINRLSFGVQSLESQVLRSMLRQHTPEEALAAILAARQAGFHNRNVDLILGYPGQTSSGFLSDLRSLIDLQPEHFSIYLLEIHERTGLYRLIESKKAVPMEEAEQLDCFETALEILNQSGYEHYEVSNFAKIGHSSRHNRKYWSDAPYYAYGAAACSYVNSTRTRNISDVSAYIHAIENNQSPAEETVVENEETRARNALIFGLRQIQGIEVAAFEQRFGIRPASLFDGMFDEYVANALLEVSDNYLRLTRRGMLLSNEILSSAIG